MADQFGGGMQPDWSGGQGFSAQQQQYGQSNQYGLQGFSQARKGGQIGNFHLQRIVVACRVRGVACRDEAADRWRCCARSLPAFVCMQQPRRE